MQKVQTDCRMPVSFALRRLLGLFDYGPKLSQRCFPVIQNCVQEVLVTESVQHRGRDRVVYVLEAYPQRKVRYRHSKEAREHREQR